MEGAEKINIISHFMQMNWIGSNLNAEIVAQDEATYYFTYGDVNDKTGKTKKLLTHYDIHKPLMAFHQHSLKNVFWRRFRKLSQPRRLGSNRILAGWTLEGSLRN